ncbi:uncharacterized protein LOC107419093 [Ziziphus jujuba]|uniref:Uncharacterized protein LOC107419093 n=1 Tax=Ziziphus jujuba TaxID=326968 RepID=A0A9B4E0C5_ZIZJJ|nr:uncharacterized protein LOC107419093 [Ziziphus jujuba]XP_015883313.3 uncharacterized protein LOC107419093 [Ziziphus jujuba]
MPGNEVGDRVHNFFGQENLSQGQLHSQTIDGNWPGLSNNLWVGSQRQIGPPFISNLKNYSVQQPDSDRGHGSQSSHVPHGLNFAQSNLKPELGRVQSSNQQPALNGYVHGHQMLQTRQNEANFLGMDPESDRHNLTSRGLSTHESLRGNGLEHNKKKSARLETAESPVSFDFFGGQQQMSGQHLNMLQSLPRQQSGMSDLQLLQRHAMLTQIQELQRQQQLQQLETRQQGFANQVSPIAKQAAVNHSSSLINGVPINESSNNSWQPELMAGNTNWLQRGASPVMQGSPAGNMFSHEQGQALRMMGLASQQADQSLYGVPISSTSGTAGPYSHMQMDKSAMQQQQQISGDSNSFSGNPYAAFPDQVSMQDGTQAPRQDFQGKNTFGPGTGQSLSSGFNLENLQQINPQQRIASMQEFQGRQEVGGSSESSQEKAFVQVTSSQNVATLDPTEEKILFGSDDNLWDAFGRNTNMGMGGFLLDGTDSFSGYPSVQSGSWSALMQSAVAETSSGDIGSQEQWCGPSFRSPEPPKSHKQPSTVNDGGKQLVWADNSVQPASALNSRSCPLVVDPNRPSSSINSISIPEFQQRGLRTPQGRGEMLQADSSQKFVPQFSEQANKWSDRGPPRRPSVEGGQNYGNIGNSPGVDSNMNSISGSWGRPQSTSSHNSDGQPRNRPNGWNFIESMSADGGDNFRIHEKKNSLQPAQSGDQKRSMHEEVGHAAGIWRTDSIPNSDAELEQTKSAVGSSHVGREGSSINNAAVPNSSTMRSKESSQQLPNSHKLDFWKTVDSSMNSKGGDVLRKNHHNMDKSPQILESSGNNCVDKGTAEMHEVENFNKKEYSSDSFRSSVLHNSTGGLRENVWSDAGDSRSLPGNKQKSSGNAARKTPGARKFQYHPMGDVDVDVEPSHGTKQTHSQTVSQQVSRGLKGNDQGNIGQSKFGGYADKNSMEMEKVRLSGQGDIKGVDEITSKSMFSGFVPNTSAPFDRGIGNYTPNRAAPASQHMLELLHKVDHQRERGPSSHLSSSDRNTFSEIPEAETSDGSIGQIQRNQSSASQGFGLQLAPPSQRMPIADHGLSSQSTSQAVHCSTRVIPEIKEKGLAQLSSTASVLPLPSSCEPSQGLSNNISGNFGQIGNKASQFNIQRSFSTAFTPGFPYARNLENQHVPAASGQVIAINMPFDRLSSHSQHMDDSCERGQTSHSVPVSVPDMSGSTLQNNFAASAETSRLSSTEQTHSRDPARQILESSLTPVTQPPITSGMSEQGALSKVSSNAWTSVTPQQPLLGAQPSKHASNLFKSQLQHDNNLVTPFPGPSKLTEQDNLEGRNCLPGHGISANSESFAGKEQPVKEIHGQQILSDNNDSAQKTQYVSQGKESFTNNLSEASSNPVATQREIEAFGRSLRPNNSLHHNYSLLHQMQAMKSTEIDASDRSVKRLKGSDYGVDPQQVGQIGGQQSPYGCSSSVRDSSANHTAVPSVDPNMLSFSSKPGDLRDSNASSQDMFAFGRNSSNNFPSSSNVPPVKGENSQISPQMAPSWFDQYGAFKSVQILPVYDMQRTATPNSMEQPFIVGKQADDLHARNSIEKDNATVDGSKFGNVPQGSIPTSAVSEHFTSPLMPPDITDQSLVVMRSKKRKSATSELLPWHDEVVKVSRRLQTISMAEADWAQATNRLVEKVEDEAEMNEDAPPILRSKRRLIFTTQLMQQLFHAPPAVLLSVDASSQYESVAYFAARLALGDACCAISCSGNDAILPPNSKNLSPEEPKKAERNGDVYFSKAVEEFIGRARKLESDLLRLDKRASILDLRMECQDMEKFSVINRFAKFHGRGQADGAETSSSDTPANAQKCCPQKYVTALPIPRNLPDRVQCLSL